jgi:hypothetical protein
MTINDCIKPISGLKYFVCLLDYQGRLGMGADVAPEYSEADIVQKVRDHIATGRPIVHVKLIDGNDMIDCTHEIVAQALQMEAAE